MPEQSLNIPQYGGTRIGALREKFCQVDYQIERGANVRSRGGRAVDYQSALLRIIDAPVLDDAENWSTAFNRAAVDHRGLNAALRGNYEQDTHLPWGIVHKGVQKAAGLEETQREAWLARMGFFGQCYSVMADEFTARAERANRFGVDRGPSVHALQGVHIGQMQDFVAQAVLLRRGDLAKPSLVQAIGDGIDGLHLAVSRKSLADNTHRAAAADYQKGRSIAHIQRLIADL